MLLSPTRDAQASMHACHDNEKEADRPFRGVLELLLLYDSPHLGESIFGIKCIQCSGDICCCVAVCLLDVPKKSKTQKNQKIKLCVHFSRASILHHCICLDMHDHGVQTGGWCSVFPGSICVSGFATPVVNCGTARVPMGLPM